MQFKTLRDKQFPELFCHVDDPVGGAVFIVMEGNIPILYPLTCTMDGLVAYWEKAGYGDLATEIKENYDLVTVELSFV